jgi:hypothetical protein
MFPKLESIVAEYFIVGSKISPGALSYCFGGICPPENAGRIGGFLTRERASEFFEALSKG